MKPGLDHLLLAIAGTVGGRIIPEMPEASYALGDAKMVAGLAVLLAQEADRAADVLVRENAAIRALFGEAADMPTPLTDRLTEAAQSADANLRLNTLEAGNAALKTLLIELHILAEDSAEDWAAPLNADIWTILKQGANDRILVLPSI